MRLRTFGALAVLLLAAGSAFAQRAEEPPPFGAGEVQKLLDGYAIIQAQEFLGLSESQYNQFLPKLRALQETRRRDEVERGRLIQELRRLTGGRGQASDTEIRDRIRALRELQTRSAADLQRAYDGIDDVLDVRQQGRFRVFEQEMELRKLQLLMRARQANRANRPLARP